MTHETGCCLYPQLSLSKDGGPEELDSRHFQQSSKATGEHWVGRGNGRELSGYAFTPVLPPFQPQEVMKKIFWNTLDFLVLKYQ